MSHPKPLYSKVTLFGHPLHPMLVGFPVAFYTGTVVGFLVFAATGEPFWYRLAYVANVAGVVMALVAAAVGFTDWAVGIPRRTAAKKDGVIHMGFNVLALLMFGLNLAVSSRGWRDTLPGAGPAIVLTVTGLFFTLCAGWYGWRLVQTHHVGIQLAPTLPPEHEHRRFEPEPRRITHLR
jgi:uncharacterized membrane protein